MGVGVLYPRNCRGSGSETVAALLEGFEGRSGSVDMVVSHMSFLFDDNILLEKVVWCSSGRRIEVKANGWSI